MEFVGLVGDGGWTSCIDWPELSVAVVSDHFMSGAADSAMDAGFSSVQFLKEYCDQGASEGGGGGGGGGEGEKVVGL